MNDNLTLIAQTLRRIQREGEDLFSNVAIFIADEARNYYVQFAAGHDATPLGRDPDSLYAEAVGNEVLAPEDRLSASQMKQLEALGWNRPHHSPNFYCTWKAPGETERAAIARSVMRTFTEVYGIAPDAPLSLKVLIG